METYCQTGLAPPIENAGRAVSGQLAGFATNQLLLLLLLIFPLASSIAQTSPPETKRNVLVLYDEPRELPGLKAIDQGLESALTSKWGPSIEIYRESLDLTRFSGDNDHRAIRDYFRQKYTGKKIEVVIAAMAPSLDFMLNYGKELFPGVPIVFCGLDPREIASRQLGPGVTGVLITRDFKGTVELVLNLLPRTHQFFFIAGTSGFDRKLTELARKDMHEFEDHVQLTYLTDLSLKDTLEQVSKLPRNAVVLYSSVFRDGVGEIFDPYEVASLVSQRANVPVFGFFDQFVGRGIVGGQVYSIEAQGKKAAELALRILDGEKVADIPIVEGGGLVPTFDWRQLERWHIPPDRLPVGSDVRFRVPTFWAQYRWSVIGIGFVLLAQAFFIVVLVMSRRRRRRAESELRESEARFRIVADAAPVLIWMAGLDKLCNFFNKSWLEFTGRTIAQEMGNGWSEGVHPDDLPRCLETYVSAFDNREPFVMQYRLRRHDGQYRLISDNGIPRYDERGDFAGYIGSCLDVTELMKKEEALRGFRERVSLATDAAQLGVWELDTTTNELWMSDKARALFQFEPDAPLDYAAFENRVHPEDRAHKDFVTQRAIANQGEYETEYRVLLPDGTVRWIGGRARCLGDAQGKLTRLLGVSMDVTARKQAHELFRLATEASPSGIVLVNNKGRILLVNAHVEELFGYGREELLGQPVDILVPEGFAQRMNFLDKPETQAMGRGRELAARRKDGSQFPVEIGLNSIQTPDGVLVLAAVIDISARKRALAEARQIREELDHLSRVALMGEMSASFAHELNQPLTGIVSNASAGERFIDRGVADLKELRDLLADISADGRRAGEVVRGIRSMVKKGSTVRRRVSLNDVVMNAVRMINHDAVLHSCELKTSLEPNLPTIDGDPVQLQQVLLNLVLNAFDAMRDTPVGQRKVVIATERNGHGVICASVRDQGTGISEEARARLFEQFFTTKAEGLGMGLAIVRSIVEAHAGTIAAENVASGGARFHFSIPASNGTLP